MEFARPVANLIRQLGMLPGIGPRSAQRLALHILKMPVERVKELSDAVMQATLQTKMCQRCCNISEQDLCPVCANPNRDEKTICAIADPRDMMAIERTSEYHGYYHVLHGVISPLENVGPEQLKLRELLQRCADGTVTEVILALPPTVEGETTSLYIARMLKPLEIRVTKLAQGMPSGTELDYADHATLVSALEWRREI